MSVDYSEDSEKSEMAFHHPLEWIAPEENNTKEKEDHLEILLDPSSEERSMQDSFNNDVNKAKEVEDNIAANNDKKTESSAMRFRCIICEEILNIENQIWFCDCSDKFCKNCIFQYIKLKIEEGQVLNIPCINHECHNLITETKIKSIASPILFEKYLLFKNNEELSKDPFLRWCPRPDCKGYDIGCLRKNELICNVCQYHYCYYCGEQWHPRTKCKANIDKDLDKWGKAHGLKYCPNCRRKVEKRLGCDHMTCIICKYEWCWLCGERYSSGHLDNCSIKQNLKRNPPLLLILALLFSSIILIFISPIISIIILRKINERNYIKCCRNFLMKTWISYPIFALIGLLLSPIFFAVAPIAGSVAISSEILKKCHLRSNFCSSLGSSLALIGFPLFIIVIIIGLCCCSAIGFVGLIYKLYIYIRRCCDPSYLLPKTKYGLV